MQQCADAPAQVQFHAAQGSGACFPTVSFFGNRLNGLGFEVQLHVVHAQESSELLHQGVAWFRENRLKCVFV